MTNSLDQTCTEANYCHVVWVAQLCQGNSDAGFFRLTTGCACEVDAGTGDGGADAAAIVSCGQ